jgi:hypothetical protein
MGEGADGKSALEIQDAWQFLVDFLQQSTISCKLWYIVVVYDFLLLVFVVLTNVNILLSSGREFMLLFLVHVTYAIFKEHVNNRRVEELDLQELDLHLWLYKGINYKIVLL